MVMLSGWGEDGALRCEQAVRDAGAEFTIVRSSWFSQNFSEGYLLEPVLDGGVAVPVEDMPEPFVDTRDIADIAVAALTEDGHAGQLYEVSGPRLLTFAEAVGEIAKAADREIACTPVTIHQYRAALAEPQVPAEVDWLLSYLFSEVLDGRNAHLTDGVQRALDRAPRDFADFARYAAAAGVWARR